MYLKILYYILTQMVSQAVPILNCCYCLNNSHFEWSLLFIYLFLQSILYLPLFFLLAGNLFHNSGCWVKTIKIKEMYFWKKC